MKVSRTTFRGCLCIALLVLGLGSSFAHASESYFELEKGKPFPNVKFLDRQKNLSDVSNSALAQNRIVVFTISNDKKTPELLDLVNRIVATGTDNLTATVVLLDQNVETSPIYSRLESYSNIRFLFDPSQSSLKQFQIYITPMIYLIDTKGNLFNLIVGYSFFTPQVLLVSTEKLTQKNLDFLLPKRNGLKD